MFRSFLHANWRFLVVALYAASYWPTKAAVADVSAPHKAQLEPFENYFFAVGIFTQILVGIIADKVSARAAVNVTLLSCVGIYGITYAVKEGLTAQTGLPPLYFAYAVKGLGVFQHLNVAMTMYSLIRTGSVTNSTLAIGALLQVSVGYAVGYLAQAKFAARVGSITDILMYSAVAHFVAVLMSFTFSAPAAILIGRVSDGSYRMISAPGLKKGIFSVFFSAIPAIVFCLFLRVARAFVMQTKGKLTIDQPMWASWPIEIDNVISLTTSLFVVPALMVFCNSAGAIVGVVIAATFCVLGAMAYDPTATSDDVQAQFFFFALGVAGTALYSMPTALVAIAAPAGTKGRVIGLQSAASTMIYYHGATVTSFLVKHARPHLVSVTKTPLMDDDVAFCIAALCLGVAFIMLPGIAYTQQVPQFVNSKQQQQQQAAAASASSAQAPAASAAAAKPKKGGKK